MGRGIWRRGVLALSLRTKPFLQAHQGDDGWWVQAKRQAAMTGDDKQGIRQASGGTASDRAVKACVSRSVCVCKGSVGVEQN